MKGDRIVSATIAENLAVLRPHIRALKERAEAAEQEAEELTVANRALAHMYFSRLRKYVQLEARMGLLAMCRVQIGCDGEVL